MVRFEIEARMLSGAPFTYSGLMLERVAAGQGGRCGDDDRLIDRTIQKLRRKGLIAFTREGRATVWRPTARNAEPIHRRDGDEG